MASEKENIGNTVSASSATHIAHIQVAFHLSIATSFEIKCHQSKVQKGKDLLTDLWSEA